MSLLEQITNQRFNGLHWHAIVYDEDGSLVYEHTTKADNPGTALKEFCITASISIEAISLDEVTNIMFGSVIEEERDTSPREYFLSRDSSVSCVFLKCQRKCLPSPSFN